MQSILKRLFPREPLPNISIMGLDGVGKTTLLYKFRVAQSEVVTTIPTIGMNIEAVKIQVPAPASGGEEQRFAFQVADAGGCARNYPLVRRFLLDDTVSALVWVFDANSTDWFEINVEELGILLHGTGDQKDNVVPSIPILV
jgi:GTPase SAR1 family protein